MKTYIFIIRRICNISGAQQYVYNKMNYLESQGWRVLIFSSMHGPILINSFEKYQGNIIPALYFSPSVFRKGLVESTIDRIVGEIGDCNRNDCIIESDALPRAIWGELIASRLNCRHLAFFMQEWHHYDDEMKNFLRFKYERHELAGITRDSIHQMFRDEKVEGRDDTLFIPFCNNVFDDCEDKFSKLLDRTANCTLGSVGRLNKPCVPAIVEGFCSYAKKHPEMRINIVMIGGSKERGKYEYVRKQMKACDNVNLVLTGDMYPIPLAFAEKIDVFVSTAGAATATYSAGFPTVKVNPITGEAIGIMGLDNIEGKSMYRRSSDLTIPESIDKTFKETDKIEYKANLGKEYKDRMYTEFERQVSFTSIIEGEEYYDKSLLLRLRTPNHDRTRVHLIHCILGHVFGANILELIRKAMGKI